MEVNQGGAGMPGGGQPDLSYLKDATDVVCEECENDSFVEQMKFKKISRFVTGADRDSLVPIPVLACSKCGHINEEFKPKLPQ